MSAVQTIITLQAELMEAIDTRNIGAIEEKTRDLARAVEQIRNRGAMLASAQLKDDVGLALKQTEALRTRVNFMALRNREKIEQLNQLRGAAAPHVYANRRNPGITRLPA